MSPFRLRDRDLGAQFCQLERSLIFNEAMSHIGFVHHEGTNTFRLLKSKFTEIYGSYVYTIPRDLRPSIEEGSFISVEPGRVSARISVDRGRFVKGKEEPRKLLVAEVESVAPAVLALPSPELPRDEFLDRISRSWRSAREDMLDKVMALLMVSAPSSLYGSGGIGSEGLEVARDLSKGTPRNVADTVLSQLPAEFRMRSGSPYYFTKVDSLTTVRSIGRNRSDEGCFTLVHPHRVTDAWTREKIPIQLPFILREAQFRGRLPELDLDVLDFQLTALYTPPPAENMVEEMMGRVKKRGESLMFDAVGLGMPDQMASVRIALSLARLNVGRVFRTGKYVRPLENPLDEGERLYYALMEQGMEEVGRKKEEERYGGMRSHPWRERLKDLDRRIYYRLRISAEESGVDRVPRESIMPDIERRTIDKALDRLNRYGYILFMKGGTEIKVVVESSPEDES